MKKNTTKKEHNGFKMEIPPMPEKEALGQMSNDVMEYMVKRSPSASVIKVFEKFSPKFRETKELDAVLMHTLAMLQEGGLIRMDNKHKSASLASFVLLDENKNPIPYESIDNEFNSPTFGNWITTPYEKVVNPLCYDHFEDKTYPRDDCAECEKQIQGTICQDHGNPLLRCEKCLHFTKLVKLAISPENAEKWINEQIQNRKKQNLEAFLK